MIIDLNVALSFYMPLLDQSRQHLELHLQFQSWEHMVIMFDQFRQPLVLTLDP